MAALSILVSDMIDGRGVLSDVANSAVSDTLERRKLFVSRLSSSRRRRSILGWDQAIAAPWHGSSYFAPQKSVDKLLYSAVRLTAKRAFRRSWVKK